jgi:iron complex transport system ATP-binding protein
MKKHAPGLVRVRIKNLFLGYPGQVLFEDLNLELRERELVCFMGPNGAGKSTLIRTIAGLQQPLSGTVSIEPGQRDGSIVLDRNIALVLTDPVKALNMTVREIVTFGRYPYLGWNIRLDKNDHEIIEQALLKVNITHLRDKKLHQLSDGQIQMVMIARAVAQDTPVIILDEPTAHLDLNNRVEIMRLLAQLTREANKTILLATHELDLALQTADLIWLTGNSRNIITGIPEDLVLNNAFDETFKFKGFDLKTGKVQHAPFKQVAVHLTGHDHVFLWTKNALERNGYSVVTEPASFEIQIRNAGTDIQWILNNEQTFSSVSGLIIFLEKSHS